MLFARPHDTKYSRLTDKVSGLKEDLGLEGNQYSVLLSLFTAG
jgi:hypothetical protein